MGLDVVSVERHGCHTFTPPGAAIKPARKDRIETAASHRQVLSAIQFRYPPDRTENRIHLREPLHRSVRYLTRCTAVLAQFKERRIHLALVIDEHGSIQGMFTLNDVLEAIVGELPSISEVPEQPVVHREDGSWLVDGRLPIDEFNEVLGIKESLMQNGGSYRTVAGFVIEHVKKIPVVGDHFIWHGLRSEVVDMDGNRVDKVLVKDQRGV